MTTAIGVSRREYRFPREDGCWLHVAEWGSAAADVTVVLAHGWSLSHQSWEDVAELLVNDDPSLRVIAYDHRGHGDSAPTRASLELLADDLASLLRVLVPTGSVVLAGHSMGGMTLMTLAERFPDIVRERCVGAAFVATSAGNLPAAGRALLRSARARAVFAWLIANTKPPTRPLFLVRQFNRFGMFGARPRRHDMNRVVLQSARSDRRAVSDMGLSMYEHRRYDALAEFAQIDTVVMVGSRDTITPPGHSRSIVECLPDARFIEFPTAGHHLPYEQSGQVAAQLLKLTLNAAGRIEVA